MNELLNKLSSYNVFNYLLPGTLFAVLGGEIVHYSLVQRDVFTGVFLYYFLGLIVSRFGSLIIEPILKGLTFVKFAPYEDFVSASQKDAKLEILSEVTNMYRTLVSLIVLLLLLRSYVALEKHYPFLSNWNLVLLAVSLLAMFLFSYRKQTLYITKRINTRR